MNTYYWTVIIHSKENSIKKRYKTYAETKSVARNKIELHIRNTKKNVESIEFDTPAEIVSAKIVDIQAKDILDFLTNFKNENNRQ